MSAAGNLPVAEAQSVSGSETPGFWSGVLRPFARVTSGGRFVPCVDGLRCIAILAVVLYHLNGYVVDKAGDFSETDARQSLMFHLLHGANCGVQLFFAISGFILALPFAREQLEDGRSVSLKQYYFRRITRLEPPFLINLLIIWMLLLVVKNQSAADLMAPLAATATYTHNWIYGTLSTVNAVTWSLEIEVQFYVLAPFLARWYFGSNRRTRRTLLLTVIAAMIALKLSFAVSPAARLRLGLGYVLDHFLIGIFVADVFVNSWNETAVKARVWDLVTLVTLPLIFCIQLDLRCYHFLPVLSGLLFVSAFRGPVTNRLLSLPLIVVTGGMCYSIYLYHFLVISFVGRFTMSATDGLGYVPQLLLQSLLIVPPVLAVCAVFFVMIEKPFMKWRPARNKVQDTAKQQIAGTRIQSTREPSG